MSPPLETSRQSSRYLSDLTYWFTSDIVESVLEHLIKIGIIRKIVKNRLTGKVNHLAHACCADRIRKGWQGKTNDSSPFMPLASFETVVTISPDQNSD